MTFSPSRTSRPRQSVLLVLSTAVLGAVLASGCAPTAETPDSVAAASSDAVPSPSATPSGSQDNAASLTIEHPWVKAAADGMTGAFGSLTNSGTEDLQVVAASSPAAAAVELHETVVQGDGTATMAESGDGFSIPAGDTFLLEPGANHLMLMGLDQPILAGDEISFTLTLSDGSSVEFTAPAKDFAGANESYHGG